MSETNQSGGQEAQPEEIRVLAMLGLENDDDQSESQGDEGEEDQPEQGAASEEDQPEKQNDSDEAQDAPIDPPEFWAKEAKEHWAEIPPSTREYIVQRESERNSVVEQSQRESAEARRQAHQLAGEMAQERAYLSQQLVPVLNEVGRRLQGDYSPETMADLARTNPAEYVAKLGERDKMMATHAALQAEHQRSEQLILQGELARLAEAAPEVREKGTAPLAEWSKHAQQHGFTPQELGAVKDHRVFLVLRDLAQTKAELAALKAAKDAPARKAVQSVVTRAPVNASRARSEGNTQQWGRRQIMQAARSGDADAQAEAVAAMFGLKG